MPMHTVSTCAMCMYLSSVHRLKRHHGMKEGVIHLYHHKVKLESEAVVFILFRFQSAALFAGGLLKGGGGPSKWKENCKAAESKWR